MTRLEITKDLEGMRTTEAVVRAFPGLAAYNLKKMLRQGDIRLNGVRIRKDFETAAGDIVEIYLPDAIRETPRLEICYEDRNIIVINKMPGIPVRDADGREDLCSMVRMHMENKDEYIEELGCIPVPLDVLDEYTGGLTLVAKNSDAYDSLHEAGRQRRIRHVYQAIVRGEPPRESGEFQHFYLREGQREHVLTNRPPGAVPMYTRYHLLTTSGEFSLLELEPVTGLRDQVRIHLLAVGYPVVGDPVYGDLRLNRRLGLRYQALWSTEMAFSTGSNNILEYLNGQWVRTDDIHFPLVNIG
ncbi:MAG: RluA family pseudouridine synthase [Clostridia bacterium]|nr:RluA family pseudouridine synthase [Clostridia bacterium]